MKYLGSLSTRHVVYLAGLVLLALVLASCAGIDLGDLVKVKTPNAIQQTTGLRATLSLNEAEAEYQNWFNQTQATGAQWKGNIEKAGPCSAPRCRHSPASSACSSALGGSARRRKRRSTRAWRRGATWRARPDPHHPRKEPP